MGTNRVAKVGINIMLPKGRCCEPLILQLEFDEFVLYSFPVAASHSSLFASLRAQLSPINTLLVY